MIKLSEMRMKCKSAGNGLKYVHGKVRIMQVSVRGYEMSFILY